MLYVANAVQDDGSGQYHLDIQLHNLATKILVDQNATTPKAVGVECVQGEHLSSADPAYSSSTTGTAGYIAASKEVTISAGTFNAPQLLQLSGIGACAALENLSIPVIVDAPGVRVQQQDR